MDHLRAGIVSVFESAFRKLDPDNPTLNEKAAILEAMVHMKSTSATYAAYARNVNLMLTKQIGPFPDEILGAMFISGAISVDKLIAMCADTRITQPDPREIIRRMFARSLLDAGLEREKILAIVRALEISCFNAAVRISKMSEDPPRRNWDSAAFVDIYGTRCGAINCLLDPKSSVHRTYSVHLIDQIRAGTISIETLGDAAVRDLCPESMDAERLEIATRTTQKVKLKESSLFRCPHCGERRCTYQEVQRRSLDEAPDYLCLCLNCNRRFTGRS